jgi:hypothetical protein
MIRGCPFSGKVRLRLWKPTLEGRQFDERKGRADSVYFTLFKAALRPVPSISSMLNFLYIHSFRVFTQSSLDYMDFRPVPWLIYFTCDSIDFAALNLNGLRSERYDTPAGHCT